ncbi:hypothetical protein [Crocosphaera chwakensis]|uniref:Uncharacterized protein n=1 Tax=Crocosphaera chwakensis CCY0110 TaxID=391612 RepID=A3IVQ5_9CHRO|nr:hypothetical protein [Crocosphaera chwakensis]EAZ89445.1 hypothetical protein CY0110_27094 [Crocosphaera chwakensis CCY0110]
MSDHQNKQPPEQLEKKNIKDKDKNELEESSVTLGKQKKSRNPIYFDINKTITIE